MQSSMRISAFIVFALITSNLNMFQAQTFQQDRGIFLKFIQQKFLVLKTPLSSLNIALLFSDRNGCVSYCLTYSSCKSANFRISTGECSLFGVNSWEIEFTIVSDIDNIIIQKIADPVVTHGNWTLVFRGLGNIDKSVYDAYTNTSLGHDQPLSPMYTIGCLRLDTNLSCDHHFRSNILNKWSNQTITEVKFGIYKDGVMEKFFLFNGSSSTLLSWFSSANLIDSSWSDLTRSPIRSFSIQGYADPNSVRRMYVQKYDPGCDVDTGWFVCVDKATDWCPWGRKGPTFPRFLYSPANTSACNKDMTAAEIIAIFIKF